MRTGKPGKLKGRRPLAILGQSARFTRRGEGREAGAMRRFDRNRLRTIGTATAVLMMILLAGAGPGLKNPLKKRKDPPPLKTEETIGDIANVKARDSINVEGVGLVVGLDGTGADAEPSVYRKKLIDQMRKARIEHAERYLSSKNTAIVLIRGTIPVGVTPEDRFDMDIELTPASTTTSLAGGHLLTAELSVVKYIKDGPMEGQLVGWVGGPILTGTASQPENLRVGRVLGGAHVKKDIPYNLVLHDERKGGWVAASLERTVNLRFFDSHHVDQKGMANAVTDQYLVLNVPKLYHHNQWRYFQVLEKLPMIDTLELRAQRQAKWGKELLDPKTAGMACLKLEGMGRNSAEILKTGLQSDNAQVRFFAAESLAYLGDPSGVDVLADAATNRAEFRAFAFAALAALDEPASQLRLRDLMANADPKVRYGAFNALRIIDRYDPSLGHVRLMRDPEEELRREAEEDAMAMSLDPVPRRRRTKTIDDPFELYVVDCEGPPLIHVANTRRCEIVVFGRRQKLLTPVVLGGGGPILLNAGVGDESIFLSRIGSDGPETPDLRTSCPPDLGTVIQEAANLGASYPDIVGILKAAERQRNLSGPLVIDAVPLPGVDYDQAQIAGVDATDKPKKDDALQRTGAESEDPAAELDESKDDSKGRSFRSRLLDRFRRRDH
jgi:flagellar basal body P-ring protein FlgI